MILNLKVHTVVLLVGPSGSGKSFFSKNNLIPQVKQQLMGSLNRANIQYLSSDDIRRDLLGNNDLTYNHDRNTLEMQAVSEQAFDLLYKKLALVTSYPVNAELVIVDTTGLNLEFRNRITSIAHQANYNTCCVVFSYKDRDEYSKYINETHNMVIVSSHIKRLNQKVLAEIRKRDFDSIFYIKKKDFSDIEIQMVDAAEYATHFLPTHLDFPIIGDLHGCFDELMAILDKLNFKVIEGKITSKPSHKRPILLGDFIDSSNLDGVEKVIDFLYNNKEHFEFVTGNHENFVYRHHKKDLDPKSLPPQVFIDEYFPTTRLLEAKPEVAEKFCVLKELSKDFLIGRNFIATHSPCAESALGKMKARKSQRNFSYPRREVGESLPEYSKRYEDALMFIKDVAATNKPFHIFGHCKFKNVARVKNKLGIDTGCAQGGRLTAATVVGSQVFFIAVSSSLPLKEELAEVFTRKDAATVILPDVKLDELDSKELNRIKWAAKNKINYISGTMSPADKDLSNMKLETMSKALDYFKSKDIERVCLQPKYMGSRAELFLNCTDVNKSYTSTRRGHLIDHVDLADAYAKILTKLKPYADEHGFEWLYLDCELMPWYALGKGLIEAQYRPVQAGIESEIRLLKETGFEAMLDDLIKEYDESGYAKLCSQLTKDALKQELSSHKVAGYEAIKRFQWVPLEEQEVYFTTYKRQLELFASQGEIQFRPFSILKAIRHDRSEVFYFDVPNSKQFQLLADDDCISIDLNDVNALAEAEKFYNSIMERELEGVVVKPEVHIGGVAPFLKVRSERYLSIIYGYDYKYPAKYERLVKQKRIDRKLRASIDEFEYGKRMLEIPRDEISVQNKNYASLFAQLIFEEKQEATFDPRL
jgi:predicted kinase